jgi:hypothetical protein
VIRGRVAVRYGGPQFWKDLNMVNAHRARSRTFIVTGAASGIGLATAQRLLATSSAPISPPHQTSAPTSTS